MYDPWMTPLERGIREGEWEGRRRRRRRRRRRKSHSLLFLSSHLRSTGLSLLNFLTGLAAPPFQSPKSPGTQLEVYSHPCLTPRGGWQQQLLLLS